MFDLLSWIPTELHRSFSSGSDPLKASIDLKSSLTPFTSVLLFVLCSSTRRMNISSDRSDFRLGG